MDITPNGGLDTREQVIRSTYSLEQCIEQIQGKYHATYNPNLLENDAWDQLLMCESVDCSSASSKDYHGLVQESGNGNVSGMINDGCKRQVKFELTDTKRDIIEKLKECTYRTSPIIVASLLCEFFKEWPSKEDHWLYIAQTYNPRAVIRTINRLVKLQTTGFRTVQLPSAYFTYLIKFRKKRRSV